MEMGAVASCIHTHTHTSARVRGNTAHHIHEDRIVWASILSELTLTRTHTNMSPGVVHRAMCLLEHSAYIGATRVWAIYVNTETPNIVTTHSFPTTCARVCVCACVSIWRSSGYENLETFMRASRTHIFSMSILEYTYLHRERRIYAHPQALVQTHGQTHTHTHANTRQVEPNGAERAYR